MSAFQQNFRRYPVTVCLVTLCVVVYAVQFLLGPQWERFFLAFGGLSRAGLAEGFYWQLLSHMALHGNFLHLFVNMLALWFAGRVVEEWIGGWKFLAVFMLGGVAGGLLQIGLDPGSFLIGASGGVCAVLLTFAALEPDLPITALLFFVVPVRLKARTLGAIVIGLSIAFPLLGWLGQIGHFAHLGGALVGLCYGVLLRKLGMYRQRFRIQRAASPTRRAPDFSDGESGEMERILNKVIRQGIHSLDPSERKLLDRWNAERSSR